MKAKIEADGSLQVSEETLSKNDKGAEVAGERSWSVPAPQVPAHVRNLDDKGHTFAKLSKGDKSAAQDAAREYEKQRDS